VSDRGGAGPQINMVTEHREMLAARERGEIDHPLLADVRSLDREQIDELADYYGGRENAAARIAAAAVRQLANVRIATGIDDGRPAFGRGGSQFDAKGPSLVQALEEI